MAQYKVGLVGLGEISSYFMDGVRLNPKSQLVAVCRKNKKPEDAEKYKAYKFYTDWKLLVKDPEVNTIIIATPPSNHAEVTELALTLGKRVIVEKPFSTKFEDAPRCAELAKKNKTHLYFAYHAAFNPLTLNAKEQVKKFTEKGDKITSFKVIFKEDVRNYHGNNSWIFEPAIAGGGCLIDSGVNAMSVVNNVGVGFVVPTSVKLGFKPDFKVEISAQVSWKSPDGSITGELIQDWLHVGKEQREISVSFASGNKISFDYATGIVTSRINGKEELHEVKLRDTGDHHNTPMAHEYINIVNDAIEEFARPNYVDPLGVGPFESIMLCYQLHKKSSAKL